jgi:hypothetical protein
MRARAAPSAGDTCSCSHFSITRSKEKVRVAAQSYVMGSYFTGRNSVNGAQYRNSVKLLNSRRSVVGKTMYIMN